MTGRFLAALAGAMLLVGSALAQGEPPPLPAAPPPLEQVAEWYVAVDGAPEGPMTLDEALARDVSPDTLVWRDGMDEWRPAGEVAEFAAAAPAQEETADDREYYVDASGAIEGPVGREVIETRIAAGDLRHETLIWFEGLEEWTPLGETHLEALLVGPEPMDGTAAAQPPESGEPSADAPVSPPRPTDPAAALVGSWQGRIQQPIDGVPQPVDIDVTLTFADGGALSGSGSGLLDLREHGMAEPVTLNMSLDGTWSAEAMDGNRLRLRSNGTIRIAAPEIDVEEETESFDESEIIEVVDPNTLRYDDGSTLRRAGG